MIGIGPPSDQAPLLAAAANAAVYDWIIFTSANAVNAFRAALDSAGIAVRSLPAQVAAVGVATRTVAEEHGFQVTVTPQEAVAESLVAALGTKQLAAKNILLPGAAATRDVLPPALRQRGAIVTVVEAYRNVLPADAEERARLLFRDPVPDWVIFASSSAVENAARLVSSHVLRKIRIASIGPVTTRTVEKLGFSVAAEANPHNVEGLVKALIAGAD
jgi:uroporphyrinogen-III synthase